MKTGKRGMSGMKVRLLLEQHRGDQICGEASVLAHSTNYLRNVTAKVLLGLAATCLLLTGFTSAAYAAHHPAEGVLGSAAQPSFGEPAGIAVDLSTGDVLVIDLENQTVSRFKPNGEPAPFSALSGNVIDGHAGEEDETPSGVILSNEGFGPTETEIAVAPPGAAGGTEGDIYITNAFQEEAVDIFASSGKYIGKIDGEGYTCGVAVDESGTVYVGDYNSGVHKLTPTAPASFGPSSDFSHPEICQVAAGAQPLASGGSEGFVFATKFQSQVFKVAAQGPEEGQTQYVVNSGNNTTAAVDPTTGHVYVGQGAELFELDASSNTAATQVSTIALGSAVNGVGLNASGQIYVSRTGEANVDVYGPLTPPEPPLIENQHVVSATSTEATIEASINPNDFTTTARVEYGLSASYDHSTPAVAVGADETFHSVRLTLQGLTPGEIYHFRITASNAVGTVPGPDQTLLTSKGVGPQPTCANSALRTGPAARLADCRAYEMVTPVDKNNLDIATLLNLNNNPLELDQSATSGEKLTYTTLQGFDDTQGVPYVSQYIASRTAGGWSNESITPPQGRTTLNPAKRLELEFQLFSPDLCLSLLNHYTDPPLASGAFEEQTNIYSRTNCGEPRYETVGTQPQSPGEPEAGRIQGLSDDQHCVLFVPTGRGLYENCAGQTKQINLLPDGSESSAASAGSGGTDGAQQEYHLRYGNYQHAISSDGSRVYWSSGSSPSGAPLYVRRNAQAEQSALGAGSECLEPDKACTIPVSEEQALFWAASPDGSRAIYSVERGGGGGNQARQELYEYDLATGHSTLLASEVLGVMGVDEQADRTYFVSLESEGQGVAGEPNLYLFDSTKTGAARFKFIATVSQDDGLFGYVEGKRLGMVQEAPSRRVARVSPDGLHAVFAAYAPLTGYDNTDAVSGKADLEVFVYDALGNGGAGSLSCISCNPSGQRPHGIDVEVESEPNSNPNWAAALVPPYTTSFYGPRAMSDNGQRVFFDSYDALRSADTNGKEDVYEWEALGSGPSGAECTEAGASFSPPNGGCLALVSSGESSSDSEFVDASPDGRDVFFKTASSLVPQDPGLIDIYDAREEGGFPSPAGQSPACEGEACQSPGTPPAVPTASSKTFSGPGNLKPKKCPKGKVHSYKHGNETCKKKHKKNVNQPKNAQGRARNDRGAAR